MGGWDFLLSNYQNRRHLDLKYSRVGSASRLVGSSQDDEPYCTMGSLDAQQAVHARDRSQNLERR